MIINYCALKINFTLVDGPTTPRSVAVCFATSFCMSVSFAKLSRFGLIGIGPFTVPAGALKGVSAFLAIKICAASPAKTTGTGVTEGAP